MSYTTIDEILDTLIDVLNAVEGLPDIRSDEDWGIPDNAMEMDLRTSRAFYDYFGDDYEHGDIYGRHATSISSTIRVLYVVHYDSRVAITRRKFMTDFPSRIRVAVEQESGPGGAFQDIAYCRIECTGIRIDMRNDPKFGILALFKASEYEVAPIS